MLSMPWLKSQTPEKLKEINGQGARVALIGCGSRGQYHLHNLKSIPHAEVVALCDDYEPNLKAAAELYPKARLYSDYRSLLEASDVDGVIIATPLHLHAPMTLDALAAGKHVFCEKAMARTMSECRAVYEAYKRSDKALYFCMQRMYDPKYIKGMERVHSGLIGEIVGLRCHWFRNADWRRAVPSPERRSCPVRSPAASSPGSSSTPPIPPPITPPPARRSGRTRRDGWTFLWPAWAPVAPLPARAAI